MSASDKKKIRKEEATAALTEKQRQQQAEARKLKAYTVVFVTSMILVVCVALAVLGVRAVNNSGIIQKNTIAASVGDNELNSVELSYYYNDAISEMYNQYASQSEEYATTYLQALGLDTTKPLNEQIQNKETGATWADYFLETAISNAKSDYALYELAKAESFTLPDEDQTTMDNVLNNISTYASLYGYSNANQYLRASYGYGASLESYSEYYERGQIAAAYKQAHEDALTYDDAAIREYETDKLSNYNSYTYSSIYLSYSAFQEGGTEDENGTVTYSDDEKDAARATLKTVAEELATAATLEELEAKAAEVAVTDESTVSIIKNERVLHTSLNLALSDWLSSEERKEGDIAAIPNESTTTVDSEEVTKTNGYYIVVFHTKHDNAEPMSNVRHLLVSFEGGTTDEETGTTTYSDEEKAAAKEAADGYLKTWQEGDATEDSFIELVKEHTDDSSAETGGLYENIHPDSQYVDSFLNWSISEDRQVGDTEVIESEYGYHVMYYVGNSDMTYRDYMISNELRTSEQEAWYNSVLDAVTATILDTSKMRLDLVLSSS